MRTYVILLAASIGLFVGLTDVQAEEKEPTISRAYAIKPLQGQVEAFEEGMKKQIDWYKGNNETWHWRTWQWVTGPKTGQYAFRSPGHDWKDMDDRAERAKRAAAHFSEAVGPHVEGMHGFIERVLPNVSRWPEDWTSLPMVTVHEYKIHYGMSEDFLHVVKKIHEAIVKADWDAHYAWLASVSGGEANTFILVVPHQSWSDMERPEKPFWEMMDETVGRTEAAAIKHGLKVCVRTQHSALMVLRPDLSYTPEDE